MEASITAMTAGRNSPAGMRAGYTDQGSLPIQAQIGSPSITGHNTYKGTSQNTPPGPPIWQWNKYDFMYNAYHEGGGFFDGSALVKSYVETDDQYFERCRVSYYENFTKPIIDATYLPVFSEPIKRETTVNGTIDAEGKGAPLWDAFLKNCDRKGTPLPDFMLKVAKHARMLGSCFVVMDNYKTDEIPELLKDQLAQRKLPFVVLRFPQQVEMKLLKLDEADNIEEIAFVEKSVVGTHGESEGRWKKWTSSYCVMLKLDKDNNFIELPETKYEHGLERVPVIPVFSSQAEEGTIIPMPPFYSIARCNWALFNICSSQMRLLRSQMFAILCAPKVEGGFAASANKGFELPADNTATGEKYPQPFYLTPPVGPYQEITETIRHIREELYRLAGQEGVSGVRESRSGIAKAFDFSAEAWVLKDTAHMSKTAEEKIACLFKCFTIEEFEFCATYTEQYTPTYYDDRLTRNTKIMDSVSVLSTPYNPIIAALIRDMVSMFFQGSDEQKQEIFGWIDVNTSKVQEGEAGEPKSPEDIEQDENPVKDLLAGIVAKFKGKLDDQSLPSSPAKKKAGTKDASDD